jgi:Bacterial SH3 domain
MNNTMKLPRIESLVLVFCFFAVVIWAVSKCNSRRSELIKPPVAEIESRPIRRDTVFIRDKVAVQQPANTVSSPSVPAQPYKLPANPGEVEQAQQERTVTTVPKPTATPQVVVQSQTMLYVTIDGLNLRKEPGLKAENIVKLDLYEQVYFLNQKSDYTQEVNLGKELVTDYWVKVKTKSGKTGWVFGAGVHYYKQKRKGTLE